jgi:cytochrome c oxidase cbb3-type subunit III
MRSQISLLLAILLLAFLSPGCTQDTQTAAANAAPPAIEIPVGPVPGPGKAMPLPTNPYENNPVALAEGRRLFDWYNCSGCHGGHAGGGMGPSLRDESLFQYGSDPAHIFATISEGRAKGMPAWGTKIPENQIWEMVAYIKSLRTPQEPDPPAVPAEPEARTTK